MAELIAPSGTVVTVTAGLDAKLVLRGWRQAGPVAPTEPVEQQTEEVELAEEQSGPVAPTEPAKRKPGRPKKSDS